jgi:gliding motility-associated-like protein
LKLHNKLFYFSIFIAISNLTIAQQPTDCIDAVIACGNSNINLNVSGVGTQELNGSNTCSSQENNSVWLQVTLVTSGTLGFTLTPNSTAITEDYDFFVFGPNVTCGNIGQAIRCSTTNPQAANQGNNLTGMNGTSTDTAEGPGPNGNSFVKWLNVLAGETYYIVIDRPIGNSPFSLEWTGTAQFSDPPTNESTTQAAIDLETCDVVAPFNDGFTTFNLTDNTSIITGSQTNVNITYHETESDANIGIGELNSPYTNISNFQTIFVRITNATTGCFDITNFTLTATLGAHFSQPSDYILCDNTNDSDDTNGQVTFDLSTKNTEILDGQNPADINISYHLTSAEAETKAGILPNLYYNTTPFNQEIFVRIEDVLNPDCKSITTLNLAVNLNPTSFNSTLIQCDEDGLVDGLTLFNLNQANDNLTGNANGRTTHFFTNSARTDKVDGSSFSNTTNPQTIYVEVINDLTGCFSFSELTLEVSVTNSENTQLIACDDDGIEDGFYLFNLNDADNNIVISLPPGLVISYFETYDDALLETNNLNASFTNTIPYSQTIFARVENANNCYGISEILLTVNELPDITFEDFEYYCLNTFPQTIPINAAVLNDSTLNYSYSWSTGENSYEVQINEIGTYSVTVTNNANGCSKVRTITIESSNTATFQSIKVVDASQNNTITVLVSGEGVYEYRLLDENNIVYVPYQESNVFENIYPGIYTVSGRDIKNNCGVVQENVSVIGFPKFFTPNNDGKHDTWQVLGISTMFQPNSNVIIFNRYGKLIKQLNPLGDGWDGLFNGEKLPADDYWFAVTLQDGRIFKNHFTLKR